ncbi:MAG: hypothetical protein ACHQ2Z_14870, partial [Elusimicrobiota bacterium]
PDEGCGWTRLNSPELSLALLYQKCDFGFRRIDFEASGKEGQVFELYLDTATRARSRQPVITVFAKEAEESPKAAIERIAFPKLSRHARKHCAVAAKKLEFIGAGKKAYTIMPDDELAAETAKKAGDGVPEGACGPLGYQPDGLGYFEFHSGENPTRFVYVDFGQEEHPLFDEKSLFFLR